MYYLCSMTHDGSEWPAGLRKLNRPILSGHDYAAAVIEVFEARGGRSERYGDLHGDWPWRGGWRGEISYVWDEASGQLCEYMRGDDGAPGCLATMDGEIIAEGLPALTYHAHKAGDVALGMVWEVMERVGNMDGGEG